MSSQAIELTATIEGHEVILKMDVVYYVDANTIHGPNGYGSKTEKTVHLESVEILTIEGYVIPSEDVLIKWKNLNEQLIINEIEL